MVRLAVIICIFVVSKPTFSSQQQCKADVNSVGDFALIGKTYKTLTTKDYPGCFLECKKDPRCMSTNFEVVKLECELNSQTKESRPQLFKKRTNSIYSNNIDHRTSAPVTEGLKILPAKSCLDILLRGQSIGTGDGYWIDPANTGTPIQVFCDMTTDGGGWTVVKRLVLASPAVPPKDTSSTTLQVMSKYNSTAYNAYVSGVAMNDILSKMGFQQIHFYCYKKSVGRVVSIATKNNTAGQQVVRFFTDDAWAKKNFPDACGSFDRLPEDNSMISQTCASWGKDMNNNWRVNKWSRIYNNGRNRLNSCPITSDGVNNALGFYSSKLGVGNGFCDDSWNSPLSYTIGDKWQISVR